MPSIPKLSVMFLKVTTVGPAGVADVGTGEAPSTTRSYLLWRSCSGCQAQRPPEINNTNQPKLGNQHQHSPTNLLHGQPAAPRAHIVDSVLLEFARYAPE